MNIKSLDTVEDLNEQIAAARNGLRLSVVLAERLSYIARIKELEARLAKLQAGSKTFPTDL